MIRGPRRSTKPSARLVFFWALVAVVVGGTARASVFTGRVTDGVGARLADVEVFFLTEEAGAEPAASTATDDLGRYVVSDLPDGTYRVAAFKPGYVLFLGRVNTVLRSTLDLILHPAPKPGEPGYEAITESATWSMRLPSRSVWQETAAEAMQAARYESHGTAGDLVAVHDILDGRVDQVFALTSRSVDDWTGGVQGSETRMALSGQIGESARVDLGGYRSSLEAPEVTDDVRTKRGTTAFNVGLRYQTADDSSVDLRAFWAERATSLAGTGSEILGPMRQAETAWGYDAAWSKPLDASSKVAVNIRYSDASVAIPRTRGSDIAHRETGEAPAPVSNRAVHAGGAYETHPSGRHQLRVALRAQFVDLALPSVRDTAPNGSPTVRVDEAGWSLGVDAEDSWVLGAPWTLIYGMAYRHVLAERETAVLAPSVGGVFAREHVTLRMLLSYHASMTWEQDFQEGLLAIESTRKDAIGYLAEAETRLPWGLGLRGSVSYSPIRNDPVGFEIGALTELDRPLYISDGHASAREASTTVSRDRGPVRAFLRLSRGSVDGSVAGVLPYEAPYRVLAPRQLDYESGHVGVRLAGSGTDVQVELRRLAERQIALDGLAVDAVEADLLELRLLQDLVRFRHGSTWRLLLAVQMAEMTDPVGDSERDDRVWFDRPESLRQVNAGVSVSF